MLSASLCLSFSLILSTVLTSHLLNSSSKAASFLRLDCRTASLIFSVNLILCSGCSLPLSTALRLSVTETLFSRSGINICLFGHFNWAFSSLVLVKIIRLGPSFVYQFWAFKFFFFFFNKACGFFLGL